MVGVTGSYMFSPPTDATKPTHDESRSQKSREKYTSSRLSLEKRGQRVNVNTLCVFPKIACLLYNVTFSWRRAYRIADSTANKTRFLFNLAVVFKGKCGNCGLMKNQWLDRTPAWVYGLRSTHTPALEKTCKQAILIYPTPPTGSLVAKTSYIKRYKHTDRAYPLLWNYQIASYRHTSSQYMLRKN